MGVSSRHILNHGPVLGALGRTAMAGLFPPRDPAPAPTPDSLPGPAVTAEVPPLPAELVQQFVRYLGGDPRGYRRQLPPHLFPQWAFPLAARTLQGLPYPMLKVVNGGCRMEVRAPLPIGKPLQVSARLQSIDDDGRRVVLGSRVVTGTADTPEALITDFYAIVPLPRKRDEDADGAPAKPPKKSPPSVPVGAHELLRRRLPRDAGLSFAKLTGDFNPIHWVPAYARASGFKNVILHGFGSFALTAEGLIKNRFGGVPGQLSLLDVKFTRPLVLPHDVGLYVHSDQVFLGDAPGGPAYMTGRFETEKQS